MGEFVNAPNNMSQLQRKLLAVWVAQGRGRSGEMEQDQLQYQERAHIQDLLDPLANLQALRENYTAPKCITSLPLHDFF